MKLPIIASCVALGLAASASAATISAGSGQITGTDSINYNQFDDLGGTLVLTGVTLTLTTNVSVDSVKVDNESLNPTVITIDIAGDATAIFRGLAVTTSASDSDSQALGSDEPTDGGGDFAGADAHEFIGLAGSDSGSDTITTGLAQFIGTGTLNDTISFPSSTSVTSEPSGALLQDTQNSVATTDWEIEYTYENVVIVPEPSSTILLGLAGLGLISRRRRA